MRMTKRQFKPTYFLSIFVFLVLLDMIAGSFELSLLRHFTKPSILLALFIYFAVNGKSLERPTYILMLAALFFSWLGDVFLMYDTVAPNYFILGLIAFLTAHLLYCAIFAKRFSKQVILSFWVVLVVLIVYGGILFLQLQDGLGKLQVPVIVYITAILLMALTAFGRKGMVNVQSFKLVFLGALFFIVSDSILAVNKFLFGVPYSHILVMGTYATAQFLITKGVLLQDSK
jgi:uncharacterized membrane protein YhhN